VTAFGNSAVGEVAPRVFSGVLSGWLEGKTAKDFYLFLKQHVDRNWLSDLVPPRALARVKAFSKGGVAWLTIPWFVDSISSEHPDIVSLIASSEEVRAELEKQLDNIKSGLS